MIDYNVLVGYNVYAGIRESIALENVGKWCANTKHGVICGSAAVAIHLGKDIRPVTPDLDVLINRDTDCIANVFTTFGKEGLTRNRFGFSTVVDGMDVDWLIAKDNWQILAIKNGVKWHGLAVMSLPYLIISKLISNRDKDTQDLQLIYNAKGEPVFEIALTTLKRLQMSNEYSELKSELEIYRLIKH
jgi:hypothetical protein